MRVQVRILHLSDLHAPVEADLDQVRIVEACLADIARQDAEARIDLVVFSGDLAFDGSAEGLAAGRSLLLDPLHEALPGRRVILVPGNHDVDLSRIDELLELGLQGKLKSREAANEVIANDRTLAEARKRLYDWDAFHAEFYRGDPPERLSALSYVHRVEIDGVSVAVAALDTAWRASGGPEDEGRLVAGDHTLHQAIGALQDSAIRLVVMHHPLKWLADFDARSAHLELDAAGVFVLSGHEHSADPTLETSTRGAALYSRVGCLYETHEYSNSYTLLDLDPESRTAQVSIRRWWPERRAFDVATDLREGGSFGCIWPAGTELAPVHQVAIADVVEPLAEMAQEQSVLAVHLQTTDPPSVEELLIQPRFWPVPYEEAIGQTDPDNQIEQVDAIEAVSGHRVLIVNGEESSGVTCSLLWLLERHFSLRGSHLPAVVRIDPRFSIGRLRHAVTSTTRRFAGDQDPAGVPVLLAVDDVQGNERGVTVRMRRFLERHPNVSLVIGCHGGGHVHLARELDAAEISHQRVFLGRFGRRELRQMADRIVGTGSIEVVDRVLEVIHGQGLPRNPLNVAALVAVVAREEDLTAVNASGLLDAYVRLLLENPIIVDPEGLSMDQRRRERLLELFALKLSAENIARLSRLKAEEFLASFFEEIGWSAGSPGRLLDSLIRRHVLVEDAHGVGFRYPALLHLFAAKAMGDDEQFQQFIMREPMRHAAVVIHAAGLRRHDAELLAAVGAVIPTEGDALPGVEVGQFRLIDDRDGWSTIEDLEQVRRLIEPPPDPPSDEELDDAYDEFAEDPPESGPLEPFVAPDLTSAKQFFEGIALLGAVLKSSELVPNVALKAEKLKEVIHGWSLATVVMAVEEAQTGELRQLLEAALPEASDPDRRRSAIEHLARAFMISVMQFALLVNVGSVHLEGVLSRVLDDDEFMDETAHALFASMLYAHLGFNGWPTRLRQAHDRHPGNPWVNQLMRGFALSAYHRQERLHAKRDDELENLLVQILLPEAADRPGDRRTHEAQIRQSLRRDRILEQGQRRAAEFVEYD
jgi:3',5'-cyclic AMP phosphodiesterase CpdA